MRVPTAEGSSRNRKQLLLSICNIAAQLQLSLVLVHKVQAVSSYNHYVKSNACHHRALPNWQRRRLKPGLLFIGGQSRRGSSELELRVMHIVLVDRQLQ